MSGTFLKDLNEGKEFEHRVLEIIRQNYPLEKWESNTIQKGVDIVSSWWKTIEVKYDRLASTTWNLFIEISCNWVPSWINKYTSISVLAYWIEDKLYLFNVQKLKESISSNNFRIVKGWDWYRSQWVLIPIKDWTLISSKIINLWQLQ